MARRDGLVHRGHAHGIGADRPQVSDLGGRFVTGPCQGRVHAVGQPQFDRAASLVGNSTQPRRVHIRHVGKPRAESVVIWSDERIGSHQVDVVVNHHQGALCEEGIDAAGGVGENQGLDAQHAHGADREGDDPGVVPLIGVGAARQRRDGTALDPADDETAFVAGNPGGGPVRQLPVGHRDGGRQRAREIAEARPENNRDCRDVRDLRANHLSRLLDSVVVDHVPRDYSRNPAIVAVMKFASVPANIARRPSRARS